MNILVPYDWLGDFLKTKASAQKAAECLSLSSQSVERMNKIGKDWVWDIEITTNRPDCLSVYGIARELKAILPHYGFWVKLSKLGGRIRLSPVKKTLPLKVKITKDSLCPRFTALIFDQVQVKPSPKIVSERLQKVGIRSLNNVVDISNCLMTELGQPMHTFDYDKIGKNTIELREAKKGESLVTLDGVKRVLPEGTIVIEDGKKKLIDLCGIMGGKNSEVDGSTKRVLLFIQTYDPIIIRRTCQLLGFRTEAASRFEKGVDPEGVLPAMKRAISMFKKLSGARVASGLIDIYPNPPKTKKVSLSKIKLETVLGIPFPLKEAKLILEDLGFTVSLKEESLETIVPHFRDLDINIEEDLIEEIARIYGYHKLPSALFYSQASFKLEKEPFYWEEKAKETLSDWSFTETVNYSLVGEDFLKKAHINPEGLIRLSNPLSSDLVYLRPSLLPSLLNAACQNKKEETLTIFEMANVYLSCGSNQLPEERMRLCGLIKGENFYQAKGVVEALLEKFGIPDLDFEAPSVSAEYIHRRKLFHPTKTSCVVYKNQELGLVGVINPQISANFSIEGRVTFFDLDFEKITNLATREKHFKPIFEYPPIIEDLSLIVKDRTKIGEIIQTVKKIDPLVTQIKLLDSYQTTRTLRITYQDPKKTLTDLEAKKVREKIISELEKKFEAEIRS